MEQLKFGDIFRMTRERKGLGFQETADRLCIRYDLLRAIEESNVRAMPARGYARNMVSGYARFLGLDPNEMIQLYLEELSVYETRRAHVQDRMRGEDSNSTGSYDGHHVVTRPSRYAPRSRDFEHRSSANQRSSSRPSNQEYDYMAEAPRSTSARTRPQGSRQRATDERSRQTRQGSRTSQQGSRRSSSRDSQRANQRSNQDSTNPILAFLGAIIGAIGSFFSRFSNGSGSSSERGRGRRNGDPMLGTSNYMNFSDSSRGGGASRAPFILVAIIVLLVLLLIGVFVFGGHGSKKNSEVATMPVTSVTNESQDAQQETAPTSAKVEYTVDDGVEAWIEIYIDDEQVLAEDVTGEASGTYDVTGTFRLITTTVEGVHVKVEGEEQELTDAGGYIDYNFDFAEYLRSWNKAHGISTGTGTTSSSESADSTSGEDTSSDSSSDSTDATADTTSSEEVTQ